MRRRHFLTLSAGSLGGLLIYSLDGHVSRLAGSAEQGGNKTVRIPLRFLTETEALTVSAAVARIFPTDDSGPGAREAGVTIYIDRQLAGPWGRDRYRYTQPPFEDASPEFGYQGKATPRETYRDGLKDLPGFHFLSVEEQDTALHRIETTRFFHLLRRNTIEGMFSDPIHGGNAGMIGWQLIGFPGPRMSNADDIEKHYGEPFRPKPENLSEVTGNKIRPSEDEP